MAMGYTGCGLCSTGRCPAGIATQNPKLREAQRGAGREQGRELLEVDYQGVTHAISVSRETSPLNSEKEDPRALPVDASMITGVELVGSEEPVGKHALGKY